MKKYRETVVLVFVMILVGGGIALLQGGVFQGEMRNGIYSGVGSMQTFVTDLEQIARYAHDYLNGYLSGSGWGTVLPTELMQEEMERLQIQYERIAEMVSFLYPTDHHLEPLFYEFYQGFAQALEGLQQNNLEILLKAHQSFHQIDYEIFQHRRRDDPVI